MLAQKAGRASARDLRRWTEVGGSREALSAAICAKEWGGTTSEMRIVGRRRRAQLLRRTRQAGERQALHGYERRVYARNARTGHVSAWRTVQSLTKRTSQILGFATAGTSALKRLRRLAAPRGLCARSVLMTAATALPLSPSPSEATRRGSSPRPPARHDQRLVEHDRRDSSWREEQAELLHQLRMAKAEIASLCASPPCAFRPFAGANGLASVGNDSG